MRVSFYEAVGLAGQTFSQRETTGPAYAMETRRLFSSSDDAFNYLRYWLAEPHARAELKWILQRSGPSLTGAHAGADGWLHALAERMTTGAVVVVEEKRGGAIPGRLVAPPSAGGRAAALAALPLLSTASFALNPLALRPSIPVKEAGDEVLTESEWPQSAAAQIAQAEGLEQAARGGTPFCEICEAARKAREEPDHE